MSPVALPPAAAAERARNQDPRPARPTLGSQVPSPDRILVAAVALLLGLGLVIVYSASSVYAQRTFGDAEHFLRLQAIRVVVGLGIMAIAYCIAPAWLARRCGWFLLIAIALCTATLIPGVGRYVGGARRWLALGPLTLQPSELGKLAVVLVLAALYARRVETVAEQRTSVLLPVLVVQPLVVLVLAEPDLGTALVLELLVGVMVFAAGLRLRTLGLLALGTLPVFYHYVVGTPFRLRRLIGFIDPWQYRFGAGYQVTEALISIGAGGVLGSGLGESKHKLFFLPEAHTDFIFAILAEELGLVGVGLFLLTLWVLVWRALAIAMSASTAFQRYFAVGLTAVIAVPAVFNTFVVTGMSPTKGLPLPFLSYGGSHIVTCLAAVGFLLRIDRETKQNGVGACKPSASGGCAGTSACDQDGLGNGNRNAEEAIQWT